MNLKSKIATFALATLLILTSCISSPVQNSSADLPITAGQTSTLSPILTITQLTPTKTAETKKVVLEENSSPNGEWDATISLTTQERDKIIEFRVSSKSKNKEWIIEQTEWNELETPSSRVPFPYIFQWSQDNNFLYYSYQPNFNDGCFGIFRPGGLKLKRLDLNNKEIITILNSTATWMALSPDEKKLAYIEDWGPDITILEIDKKAKTVFTLPEIQNDLGMETDTSHIIWSPNGKALIYAHLLGVCDYKIWYSYIIHVNLETQQKTILVKHNDQGYIPLEWNNTDGILLKDNDDINWWLNPNTKEITPVN